MLTTHQANTTTFHVTAIMALTAGQQSIPHAVHLRAHANALRRLAEEAEGAAQQL
jgi:hypothetical protein